jgi:hypothetical protein
MVKSDLVQKVGGDQYIAGPGVPKVGGTGPSGPHDGCAYASSPLFPFPLLCFPINSSLLYRLDPSPPPLPVSFLTGIRGIFLKYRMHAGEVY